MKNRIKSILIKGWDAKGNDPARFLFLTRRSRTGQGEIPDKRNKDHSGFRPRGVRFVKIVHSFESSASGEGFFPLFSSFSGFIGSGKRSGEETKEIMLTSDQKYWIAQSEEGPVYLNPKTANRHGLIAGATGTGKTVSLQVMAETFSQAGVPCFMSDMKGDLSGISQAGFPTPFIEKRAQEFGITDLPFAGCPVRFFDVYGKKGHPLRTTISEMGPILLARLLNLNETQTGVLNILFKIADDQKLLLIDMKDLRLMLDYVGTHAKEFTTEYGNISAQSIGAIQRGLLALEDQGGDLFFGDPDFDVFDFIATENGKGVMNILAADELMLNPKLYSTFLLWLLTSLYNKLPEIGDPEKPKLVFFFDEAHTLFDGTPKALTDQIEQVVRLIRSKGVGVYFVTQLPTDLPPEVLGQLANRIQHGLRAFTPKDQKAVKTAAETFRANPNFRTDEAILALGTGEALVSFLNEDGIPGIVQRSKVLFPLSSIGAISDAQRSGILYQSPLRGKYDRTIDNVSAYEILSAQKEREEAEKESLTRSKSTSGGKTGSTSRRQSATEKLIGAAATAVGRELGRNLGKKAGTSIFGTIGKKAGNSIVRGILGSLFKR